MKTVVLASGSPRRRELLKRVLPEFEVMADDGEEELIPGENPEETVRRLAMQKAENTAKRLKKDALILAADTVVVLGEKILGKPDDEDEAFAMLFSLSGKTHRVYTGLAVVDTKTGKKVSDFVVTKVRFRSLSEAEIHSYIRSGEPMDKAGAYGIQKIGALFIESIDGDYFNVVGLPLCRLGIILKESFGIDLMEESQK
ncbi:Maf family protein [Ructibacterium gallinarum]|uniref:dTTP/UTP pyrophosphatase n=1 Tax=Ructibacterium gallinarum TaxID=2779355 RepID=A0A9D5M366_9FIRM|nr:Maf family protein [Ructibacterium gallinarum]MBE5039770.1 septum formation inhibitor Maf [Ructibacterium gallinarum]